MTLHNIRKGYRVMIHSLNTSDIDQLQKLLAMGLLPERWIYVIQTHPVIVIKIDETQLALDKELAQCIVVSNDASSQ